MNKNKTAGRAFLPIVAGLFFITTNLLAQEMRSGAFPDTSVIETQLHRGASTKTDVQRLLGVPNGMGRSEMALPPRNDEVLAEGPREIWYYENIEVTNAKSNEGVIDMKMRQQILLIFFRLNVFDGYLWTSNAFTPKTSP